ncbi:hypothetical protein DYI37_17760 [Fulvimarina endophytica]|uniref:Uncharacterized protein n=1 Tax=Fulvimarina endophytica TaxID=2293836 RepID=A0A371WYM8_9HYPH|nr:PAS domain-containing protein [Fulvimarina endophytica]RFC62091.1 hypothetical protein DYI37_17760 [Fulvimarina endophytica]
MRLYFHLRKSAHDVRLDEEGQTFATLEDAYMTACREIPDMVAEFLRQRTDAMGFAFEVCDADGQLVMEIPFREMVRSDLRVDMTLSERWFAGIKRRDIRDPASGPSNFSEFLYSPVAAILLKPSGYIEAVNQTFAGAGVTQVSHMIGRSFFEIFPDRIENDEFAGRRRLQESVERIASTHTPEAWSNQRYDVLVSGGEWMERYWDVNNWPLFNDDGRLRGIVHYGRPVVDPGLERTRDIFERLTVIEA